MQFGRENHHHTLDSSTTNLEVKMRTTGSASTATAKKPSRFTKALVSVSMALGLVGGGLAAAVPAEAAAFSYGVYTPNKISAWDMDAWANVSRDCSGTYGCYNYMKIEKREWWGWSHYAGHWAGAHGWNSIRANINGGCSTYRLTVDSFNDVASTYGGGVNVGVVGFTSNGTKIHRFKTTWSSGSRQICRG